MESKHQFSQKIVQICHRLWQRNMLAAADGNISYRMNDEEILITPSGVSKAFMSPDDMAIINLEGEVIQGTPSSEKLMHLTVYRQVPQARCVVHAHPPHAIAWSVARPDMKELPADCLSEVILACGTIPVVPFALPSTSEMGDHLLPFLPSSRVMILSRHGALSWGESLDEAERGMERLEHSSQILYLSENLGGITPLPEASVEKLKAMRQQIGSKTL